MPIEMPTLFRWSGENGHSTDHNQWHWVEAGGTDLREKKLQEQDTALLGSEFSSL